LIPKFQKLNICGVTYEGYGCPGMPFLMEGVIAMEMARIDASIATFLECSPVWQWVPFISAVQKSKNRNGFLRCRNLKKSELLD
jgi:glutaryl-CoA dehydrogenase